MRPDGERERRKEAGQPRHDCVEHANERGVRDRRRLAEPHAAVAGRERDASAAQLRGDRGAAEGVRRQVDGLVREAQHLSVEARQVWHGDRGRHAL